MYFWRHRFFFFFVGGLINDDDVTLADILPSAFVRPDRNNFKLGYISSG